MQQIPGVNEAALKDRHTPNWQMRPGLEELEIVASNDTELLSWDENSRRIHKALKAIFMLEDED